MPNLVRPALCFALAALGLTASGAEPPPHAPDIRRGEALYVGSAALSAGGAPCLACHGISGHGLARAASFGPDLSGAHASWGADGLDAMLEDVAFPSMEPIYRRHALTPAERADLIAFLGEATGQPPPRLGVGFAAGVLAAMGVFLGAFLFIGKRGAARRSRATAAGRGTP
jgi:mono/diheme cytochrome c family protein